MREAWCHVPGAMNPADLPSRGCSVQQLRDSKWWEGPLWLKLPPKDWPSGESQLDEDMVMQERRKGIVSSLLCNLMISTGIFPTRLKFVEIKPLYEKGEIANTSNYRPISLLTSFLKSLKKLFMLD